MNVKDLIKSFNRSDNLFALEAVDDNIDNNENVLKVKEKPLKNKYCNLKKLTTVAFSTSENNNRDTLSKTKKNKNRAKNGAKNDSIKEAKNKATEIGNNKVEKDKKKYPKKKKKPLSVRQWLIKMFEIKVGLKISKQTVPFSTLEKDIRRRQKSAIEFHLCKEYKEAPRPENIPNIVWKGPPLACCFCFSFREDCDCKGDIVLPPRFLPIGCFWRIMLQLHYINETKLFKKLKLNLPKLPEKPFPERLEEHLTAEAVVLNQIKKMNLNRGPEFCLSRCYNFYDPLASLNSSYFQIRKKLFEEYYKPPPPLPPLKKPKRVHIPSISEEIINISEGIIDGLYRSVATQAITDRNCEFIIEEISHILFGRANVFQDIEGTPYCICDYREVVPKKTEPVVNKMKNLLSISGIKKTVSNLTSSLMSSIVDIEETGIPINDRATQDPPLDNYYESIKVPLKYTFVNVAKDEMCPCCKMYKELQNPKSDQIAVTDIEYPLFKTQNWLRNCGPLKSNLARKQILPIKDNPFSETIKDVKHENESKAEKINDSIKLLRRDLITDKTDKKYKSVQGNKDLCAIQSESMLNVEETKMKQKTTEYGTGVLEDTSKENNQMNSPEFLKSIKPCCIDSIFKTLEKKVGIEKFVINLLEDEVFRRVAWYIYKKEKKHIDNINTGIVSFSHSTAAPKISKLIKSLKSRMNINMNKFSEFIKKQKSSLKCFAKKQNPLRSKSRNAVSLGDLKIKISKSFRKMNKAVSSFFKRHYKKSSYNIKQLMASLKKVSKKKNELDDTGYKSADCPCDSCDVTLQNTPVTRDSKISEKEVLCVQYNSTWDIFSKDNNQ